MNARRFELRPPLNSVFKKRTHSFFNRKETIGGVAVNKRRHIITLFPNIQTWVPVVHNNGSLHWDILLLLKTLRPIFDYMIRWYVHKAGLLRAWTLTQREGIIGSYFTHPSWSLWLKKGIQSFHVRGTCRAPSKYIRHIYMRKILHYSMLTH